MSGRPMRADATRNRDRLLAAATEVFGAHGLDAPLEQIARRAGVSIGTLYNHFPTRQALFDAIFPERLARLDEIAARALDEADPWTGFAGFLDGLFAMQAEDHGLNDALAQRFPLTPEVTDACHRGFQHVDRILQRAKDSGQLRADFAAADLAALVWAMSQVIRETTGAAPRTWQRCLAFFLDGLRAEAAHPIAAPPVASGELIELFAARSPTS